MWERDDIELDAVPCGAEGAPDERVELLLLPEHLLDRELSNREDELGTEDGRLLGEERPARTDCPPLSWSNRSGVGLKS